jgi:hypothetical protein
VVAVAAVCAGLAMFVFRGEVGLPPTVDGVDAGAAQP